MEDVRTAVGARKAVVAYQPERIQPEAIRAAVRALGMTVADASGPSAGGERALPELLSWGFVTVVALVALGGIAGERLGLGEALIDSIPPWLALAAVLAGGYPIFRNVVRALRNRSVTSHTLMTLGIVEARGEFQKYGELSGDSIALVAGLAEVHAAAGHREEAFRILDERKRARSASRCRQAYPWAYALLGERDQAFCWLERMYDERNANLIWLKMDPILVPMIRSDPRYRLFATGYDTKYLAVVTNRTGELAELIRWPWQKAGTLELVHDVTTNELGAAVPPCGRFGANAAWYRLSLLTDNLLSALKSLARPAALSAARPKRLRFAVFTLAGRILTCRSVYANRPEPAGEAHSAFPHHSGHHRSWCERPGTRIPRRGGLTHAFRDDDYALMARARARRTPSKRRGGTARSESSPSRSADSPCNPCRSFAVGLGRRSRGRTCCWPPGHTPCGPAAGGPDRRGCPHTSIGRSLRRTPPRPSEPPE